MSAFIDARFSGFQSGSIQGLIAHLMVVTHFVQKNTRDTLLANRRYEKLSLTYAGYISLLAEQDYAPGELAAKLGVSKQMCSKTLRELDGRGLIERRRNPEDSRSSLLSLTPAGLQLLHDGVEATQAIHRQFAEEIGAQRLRQLTAVLEKLCAGLRVELPAYRTLDFATGAEQENRPMRLSLLLPRLSGHFHETLLASLRDKGYTALKPSYGQVLGLLSREQRRTQYIASLIGVSKQAVAVTAAELERLGYIVRAPDPTDRRQIILRLSPLGRALLDESVASVQAVEASTRAMLEEREYRLLEETMATLYFQLTEPYQQPRVVPDRIQQLSQHLLTELGVAGVRTLAQHLVTITRGES